MVHFTIIVSRYFFMNIIDQTVGIYIHSIYPKWFTLPVVYFECFEI